MTAVHVLMIVALVACSAYNLRKSWRLEVAGADRAAQWFLMTSSAAIITAAGLGVESKPLIWAFAPMITIATLAGEFEIWRHNRQVLA